MNKYTYQRDGREYRVFWKTALDGKVYARVETYVDGTRREFGKFVTKKAAMLYLQTARYILI